MYLSSFSTYTFKKFYCKLQGVRWIGKLLILTYQSDEGSDVETEVAPVEEEQSSSDEDESDEAPDSAKKPLFFVYDCETTAADIFKDHITEIGATVVLPLTVKLQNMEKEQFHSLVSTSRRILPVDKKVTLV